MKINQVDQIIKRCLFVLTLALATGAHAASATWNGTTSALWSLAGNWSTSPVPGTGDTATFNNAGSAHTTLDLTGGLTINTILFDTASVAAYTIGSGAVGSQTLVLNNGGAITANSTINQNQLFNVAITLGTDATTQSYAITDSSTTKSLTFAGNITGGSTGTAGTKTVTVNTAAGNVVINGAIGNGGATSVALTKSTGTGTLTLSGPNTYSGSTTVGAGTLRLVPYGYVTPIAATAESYYSPDDRSPTHAIDGTGMSPNNPVVSSSACGNSPGGNMWLSNNKTQTWITFDLGSSQTVTGFHLWNYNESTSSNTNRGVKTCGIYTGTSLLAAGTAYASAGPTWGTLVQSFTFNQANGSTAYTGSDYTFTTPVTTRYLQIYVTANFGGDAYTGISEIRFATNADSGVPNILPASTAVNLSTSGASLDVNDYSQTIGSLTGVAGTTVTLGKGLLTVGDATTTAFAGVISDSGGSSANTGGSLVKQNAGTLTLSAGNTFTGTATVSAGTLILSGSNSLAGTVSVASGATLQLVANAGNTGGGISAAYNATHDLGIGNGNLQLRSDSSVTFGNMAKSGGFPGSSAITVDVNQVNSGNNNNTLSIFPNGVFTYNTTVNVTGGNGYAFGVGYIDGYNQPLTVNPTTANLNIGWVQYINGLIKNGAGALTLGKPGGVTYGVAGTMTVNAGTLKVGDPSSFNGSMALALAGTSVFDLNGTNATVSEISSSVATATITDNSSGTGTATLTRSGQSATETAIIKDGSTRKVAVNMANANGATTPFGYTTANTFSGGLTLLNNGTGTRMLIGGAVTTVGSAGAITSSPYGTGPIIIGQTATDKAGIIVNAANVTLANAIVANTALGTDVNGAFRVEATNLTLSGTITANLADFQMGSYGGGATAFLTGQITGSSGLHLANAIFSGSYQNKTLTSTLNNTTGNANNYAGTTTIDAYQVLVLGAANQIPNGAGAGNVNDNGTFNLGGNNCAINGLNGLGIVDGVSGTPTFTVGNNNATATFSGVIKNTAGTLALTKIGSGTQSLSGTSTYSGATAISAGVLQGVVGGSSSNSAVTVAATGGNTAALGVSITDITKQWACSSLMVNNAGGTSGLQFNFGSLTPSTTIAPLNVTGAAVFTTAPTLTILGSSVPVSSGNGYPLLTWGSGSAPSLTGVTLVLPRVSGHLAVVGNTLYLQVTGGSTEPVSWMGGNGTWDVNDSGNIIWKDNTSTPTYFQLGDTVNFDNTVGTGGTVTNNVSVSPLAVTVNNPSADYTITGSGGITGTASLTKSGGHTLTLATANTYSGPTTVSAGTLALTGSLNGSAVTVASTGTVTESGAGVIAGLASVTNSGTTTLAGANTFSGGTTLSAGQLNINNGGSSVANSAVGTGSLTIAGTATIDNTSAGDVTLQPLIAQNWNADFTYAGSAHNLNLGGGAVTLGASRQVTVSSNTLSVGGAIGGGYSLTKAGAGTLILSNLNGYSGGTTVNGGTLTLANGGSTGGIRGSLTINSNATVNLAYVDALGYVTVVNTVNINGGTLTNSSGGNEGYSCSFNLTGGTMSSSGGAYVLTTQTIASLASSTPSVVNAPLGLRANPLTLNVAAGTVPSGIDLDLSGAIGGGAYGVTKTGAGTVQLDGANTYTGTTTVSNGTLKVGSAVAFTGKGPLALAGASIFDLNGYVANVTDINSSVNTATITDNSSGTGTNTITLSNQGSTETAIIQDGSAKKVAVNLANNNGVTTPFGYGTANTFSGGLTLLNTGNGTRLRISALITGSPFGSGAITLGQTNTDKAGIFLDTVAGITVTNNIVLNTARGTDVPGIRLDTTNHTFAGNITANLANAMFAGVGGATLSGQVTGTNGLQLNNTAVAVTLSNATANPNNYQGATILGTNSVLNLGAANQIPNGVGTGNMTNYGTLNLDGYSDTINGLDGSGTVDGVSGTPTLTLGDNNATGSFDGVIQNSGGTLSLTKIGIGTETLNGGNTYNGNTTINAGSLALGSGGNINNSANLAIAAGGTFDVSTYSYFGLSGSTAVSASGTGTGSTAAVFTGQAGGTVDLSSQPVTLNFTPSSSTGDLTHPALYIPQGSLNLSGQITVNNNGSALGIGTYNLISQASGSISGTPTLFPVIEGHGLAPATSASLRVNAGNVQLVVVSAPATTTTLVRHTGTTANSTYGDTLNFDVSVTPSSASGTVVLKDGLIVIGTATLSGGFCTIAPAYNALTAGIHTNLNAVYGGDGTWAASSSAALSPAQTVSNLVITATATANSKLYDGTTAATITGTLNGVLGSDIVTLNGTGNFASAAVGTNKPVTSTATLGGSSATNYYLTPITGLTADILSETVWTAAGGGVWSTTGNWLDNIIGNGIGVTADLSTLDISAQTIVSLDVPVTLGNLVFGGTNISSPSDWYVSANVWAADTLTLAGSSPSVAVQDPLNLGAKAEIHATVKGLSGLTKTGAGTLILSAPATGTSPNAYANNYSGGTVVNGGNLTLASGGAAGEIRGSLTINSNATVSLTSVNALGYWNGAEVTTVNINGATLDNATTGDQGYDASYYLSGGTITNSGGGDYVLHGVTIASLSNIVVSVVSAPLSIHGTNLLNAAAGPTTNGIDLLISGNLSPADTNNPAVTKTGAGTVELSGANTYTGTTTVSAGTLVLSGSNTLVGAVTVASSAAVQLVANAGNTAGAYSAAYNLTNDLIIGNATLQLRSDSNVTFGDIATTSHGFPGSSSVTVDVNQVTPGNNGKTLSLYPNGVYTYNTTVNVTGGNGYSLGIGGINGYNAGLVLNPTTANLTIGPIGSVSWLIMNGTGVLTLTGGNSYTGNTTVGTGTLLVSNSGSLAAASAVIVSNNATLGGSGTINGPVTFNAGSHAVFTQGSPLTLGNSLTIATSGNIPNVHLNLPANLAAGTYTLATYNSTGSSGIFATTPVIDSGSLVAGNSASISMSGGHVNLVVGPSVNTNPATANFQTTVAGNTLNFTWAPDHLGWQLYTNAISLTAASSWFPVVGSASVTNEAVTINPANPNVFFQLRYP